MPVPRLLVADRELGVRVGLKIFLRLQGFDVRTAGSYWEAAGWIIRHPVDCLLAEMRFSRRVATNLNGLSLIRTLKTRQPEAKAILMATVVDPPLAQLARAHGAVGCLEKPFDLGELSHLLGSLFPAENSSPSQVCWQLVGQQ